MRRLATVAGQVAKRDPENSRSMPEAPVPSAIVGRPMTAVLKPVRVSPAALAELERTAGASALTSQHWRNVQKGSIVALAGLREAERLGDRRRSGSIAREHWPHDGANDRQQHYHGATACLVSRETTRKAVLKALHQVDPPSWTRSLSSTWSGAIPYLQREINQLRTPAWSRLQARARCNA